MEAYDLLFLKNYSFLTNYDIILSIPLPNSDCINEKIDLLNNYCDNHELQGWCKYIEEYLLNKAYNTRINGIRSIYSINKEEWDISEDDNNTVNTIQCGVLLNTDECFRILDKGPAANNQIESNEYRQFWGNKSELRRFKDGSILETISWDNKNRLQIMSEIAKYIISLHFTSIKSSDIICINELILPWLDYKGKDFVNEYTSPALQAFELLSNTIKSMDIETTVSHLSLSSESIFIYYYLKIVITKTSIRVPENITHNNKLSQIIYPIGVVMEMYSDIVYPPNYIHFIRMKEQILINIATEYILYIYLYID